MNKKKLHGLTAEEVVASLELHGRDNELSQKETESFMSIFIGAFKDIWIIVLMGALLLKIGLNFMHPHDANWYEVISLVVAILLSTGFAAYSEYKNAKEFEALQASASKTNVAVLRDGKLQELLIDRLVIGDIVKLRAGDQIPADGFILEGEIKVDQAALNGESDPTKKVPLGDNERPAMDDTYNPYLLLRGSNVMEGEAYMEVMEVGDLTMIGQINTSLQEDGKESPSKAKLNKLASQIGVMGTTAAVAYAVIRAVLFFINPATDVLNYWLDTLMYSVTIVIMAVPEGLPMMLAMVAGMNSSRLLKQDVLVRNGESIETAGYMNILFSDKTGTITEGKMSVVDILMGDGTVIPVNSPEFDALSDDFKTLLMNGVGLNNDSFISGDHGTGGNPTDNALMTFLHKKGLTSFDRDTIDSKELFDSEKKFASVTVGTDTYIKGAPEKTIGTVTKRYTTNGSVPFTESDRKAFDDSSLVQANRSMRVISVIHRDATGSETLIAGVCLRDNVRDGMVDTLASAAKAGVQVVMVTGDRRETAMAIAKDAGIYKLESDCFTPPVVLTHDELDALSDDEVKALLPNLRVVARALPMDKKRLVQIAQDLDNVVGMTGDGVNDSAALKAADIGYSLGDGTQTAQSASDLVLVNNSLESIITSILYGRTMTKTVQKFIMFQLTVNVSTIAMSLISPIFGFGEPFTIVQVLWINLIMDTLAALAFGLEAALRRYLDHAPISRKANILTPYMVGAIGTAGLFISIVATLILTGFANWHNILDIHGDAHVRTFMFAFFIYSILVNSLNTRSETFNLFEHISENKRFIYIIGGITIAQTFIIQFGEQVFSTVPMDALHYGYAFALALLIIPFDMIRKALLRMKKKSS